MIIKEKVHILDDVIWRVYSDQNKYIQNVRTGIIYTVVNTSVNDKFIELGEIEEEEKEYEKI